MSDRSRATIKEAAAANGRLIRKDAPRLDRVTFQTSREMDFLSERELVTQTGHGREEWPLVIVKELINNPLDPWEEAGVPPIMGVTADPCGITISDNGPGLPEATLRKALDFTIRVSNREAYVSPCRGAQGNALKTLLPMPHVLDPEQGKFIVTAHAKRHEITCAVDPISQRPVIHDDEVSTAKSKKMHDSNGEKKQAFFGTVIRLEWGARSDSEELDLWPFDEEPLSFEWGILPQIFALVEGFAVFNPHATINLDLFGEKASWKATDPDWTKWKPCQPTSPHWYEPRHLERLIG